MTNIILVNLSDFVYMQLFFCVKNIYCKITNEICYCVLNYLFDVSMSKICVYRR